MAVVEVRDAVAALGGRDVLSGVDLRVDAGEVVTLLGPNGSGKSTLVRVVLGLVPLRSGSVALFGRPLTGFRDWTKVGYVPQRTTAASGVPATVVEVVSSGRLSRRSLLRPFGTADRGAVADALRIVGLEDLAGRGVGQLSGGQQQRVLIARALAGAPDLLVLDEPMSGVDAASQDAIAGALARLAATGTSVLLVLHEQGVLGPLIDRAIGLREGRVDGGGAEHDLRQHGCPPDVGARGGRGGFGLSPSPLGEARR